MRRLRPFFKDGNLSGRLTQSHTYGNRRELVKYKYDTLNRLKQTDSYVDNALIENVYNYGSDSLLSSMYQGILYFTYTYDHLNRMTVENIKLYNGNNAKNEYTYINGTVLVATKKFYINDTLTETFAYTYDKSGNIATITQNGVLYESYTYDSLNQLKTVTKGTDVYEYTYDNGGNILNVKLNGVVTNTYVYGDENWKDKLTAYNGTTFTYDAIGNPIQYRDGMIMSWQNGRQLASLQKDTNVVQYTYNDSGLRLSKNVNGSTTNFYYDDSGNLFRAGDGTDAVWFFYGTDSASMSFKYRDVRYYYVKNLQGDITAIVDMYGNIVAKYTYDVWGKILSITDANGVDVSANASHIANINPLRYRGYYYDSETGLYYLISRYYDPETGRFVNTDNVISGTGDSVQGFNLYAYCFNNPVNSTDETGNWPKFITNIVSSVKTAVKSAIKTVTTLLNKPKTSTSVLPAATSSNKEAKSPATFWDCFELEGSLGLGLYLEKSFGGVSVSGGLAAKYLHGSISTSGFQSGTVIDGGLVGEFLFVEFGVKLVDDEHHPENNYNDFFIDISDSVTLLGGEGFLWGGGGISLNFNLRKFVKQVIFYD